KRAGGRLRLMLDAVERDGLVAVVKPRHGGVVARLQPEKGEAVQRIDAQRRGRAVAFIIAVDENARNGRATVDPEDDPTVERGNRGWDIIRKNDHGAGQLASGKRG